MFRLFSLVLVSALCASCAKAPEEPKKGIIGKKTQDIKEFDPKAKQEVSDGKINATDPVFGPLQAYGPMVEKISALGIDNLINTFYAVEGRYPKDHEEFMTKIIKENNVQLPVLPNKDQYSYDVQNHKLVIIKAPEKKPDTK